MDINKIRFVPKANAFAEVYGKATGMPFVGEMMVAAAGNGGDEPTPPTPPTPSVVESVTFYAVQNTPSECLDVVGYETTSCYTTYTTLTLNQSWFNENINNIGQINLSINDDNDQEIHTSIFFPFSSLTNVFDDEFANEGTLTEIPESGPYNITVYSNDLTPLYEGTGTWTFEDQTI